MRVRYPAAAVALAALVSVLAWAVPAQATPVFSLRVEAPGVTLDPGTHYAVPRSVLADRGKLTSGGTCVRAPGRHEIDGKTALGLVASAAQARRALRPLLVAEDSIGRRVCRIAGAIERDTPSFSGWLFHQDHLFVPMSGELAPIDKRGEVLWFFANFGTGANTGDELVLTVPPRAQPGVVLARVQAVAFDGTVGPAPNGTRIIGGAAPVTTVNGVASVPVAAGETDLRAVGPGSSPTEIPSAALSVCVAANLGDCPEARGRRIVGTNGRDKLKGSDGPDRIRARGGKDKVKVKGNGEDRVNCGRGKDVVVADKDDRLKRCERVRGPAGDGKKKRRGGRRK